MDCVDLTKFSHLIYTLEVNLKSCSCVSWYKFVMRNLITVVIRMESWFGGCFRYWEIINIWLWDQLWSKAHYLSGILYECAGLTSWRKLTKGAKCGEINARRGGGRENFFSPEFNRANIKRTTVHIFLTYFSPPLHFRHPRISQLFFESKLVLYFPTVTVPDANGSRCREVAELTEWSEVLEELIFWLYTKDISRLSWNSPFFIY